eukprot:2622006-Prymnesium_polylepis.2
MPALGLSGVTWRTYQVACSGVQPTVPGRRGLQKKKIRNSPFGSTSPSQKTSERRSSPESGSTCPVASQSNEPGFRVDWNASNTDRRNASLEEKPSFVVGNEKVRPPSRITGLERKGSPSCFGEAVNKSALWKWVACTWSLIRMKLSRKLWRKMW